MSQSQTGEGVKRVPNKGKAKGLEVSMSCDLHQKKKTGQTGIDFTLVNSGTQEFPGLR